jgi:hypothetical protein
MDDFLSHGFKIGLRDQSGKIFGLCRVLLLPIFVLTPVGADVQYFPPSLKANCSTFLAESPAKQR